MSNILMFDGAVTNIVTFMRESDIGKDNRDYILSYLFSVAASFDRSRRLRSFDPGLRRNLDHLCRWVHFSAEITEDEKTVLIGNFERMRAAVSWEKSFAAARRPSLLQAIFGAQRGFSRRQTFV